MDTKKCSKCKIEKPISDFYPQRGHKYGVMSLCRDCFNQLCVKRWINKKIKYIQYLGGECSRCHIKLNNTNYSIFDFHHLNPSEKEYSWGKLRLFSEDKVIQELNKCQLLCSNCHRIIHATQESDSPQNRTGI